MERVVLYRSLFSLSLSLSLPPSVFTLFVFGLCFQVLILVMLIKPGLTLMFYIIFLNMLFFYFPLTDRKRGVLYPRLNWNYRRLYVVHRFEVPELVVTSSLMSKWTPRVLKFVLIEDIRIPSVTCIWSSVCPYGVELDLRCISIGGNDIL